MPKTREVIIEAVDTTHNQAYYYALGRIDERKGHVEVPLVKSEGDVIMYAVGFADWYCNPDLNKEGNSLGLRAGWLQWRHSRI